MPTQCAQNAEQQKPRRVTRHLTFEATPAPSRPAKVEPNPDTTTAIAPNAAKSQHPGATSSLIQVFLRIRPFSDAEKRRAAKSCLIPYPRPDVLCIKPNKPDKHPPQIRDMGRALFKFSTIFDETAIQETVFEKTGLPLISTLFRGQSAVAFAYGVTCSGKTFTIQGAPHTPGILPRSLDVIINSISMAKGHGLAQDSSVSDEVAGLTDEHHHKRRLRSRASNKDGYVHDANYIEVDGETEYKIFASYLEIYNDQVYDLFVKSEIEPMEDSHQMEQLSQDVDDYSILTAEVPETRARPRRPALKLKERNCREMSGDGHRDVKEVYPDGQKQVRIKSVADIERLLEFGTNNRTVAHTRSNSSSSRSHAIFVITLQQEKIIKSSASGSKVECTTSKLYVVDLAGSEKVSKMMDSVNRAQESRQINTSLMSLSRCLETLQRNSRRERTKIGKEQIVPFRDSKLTRLLQRSLSSGSAVMIATMSPSIEDADETIHTLRNTAIASEVKLKNVAARRILVDVKNTHEGTRLAKQRERSVVCGKTGRNLNKSSRKKGRALRPRQDAENIIVNDRLAKENKALKDQLLMAQEHLESALDEQSVLRGRCDHVLDSFNDMADALAASNKERDQLFREAERLRDKLAHAEAKVRCTEMEVREELVQEVGSMMKDMEERYEAQIRELRSIRDEKDDPTVPLLLSDEQRKNRAAKMARRLTRTSCAAFENIARQLQGDVEEDPTPDFQTELDDEYLEEDLNVYQDHDG